MPSLSRCRVRLDRCWNCSFLEMASKREQKVPVSIKLSDRLDRSERSSICIPLDTRMSSVRANQDPGTHELTVEKLNMYYDLLKTQIVRYQSPGLGLFPCRTNHVDNPLYLTTCHVRDNVYCASAIWALSQAFRRMDDDQGKEHELGQTAVKCMRGILYCWMRQADKVEQFKANQNPSCALHSNFNIDTGDPVYTDDEHGHLQLDAVALYILFLIQMTSSGLQVIYTTDEVNFIQNLVFYLERAYRTPDYGMWERGSKYNNGSTEMHGSSIGMVKAALEACNGANLFGEQGASWSVIYVDIDAHNRNRTIFETILPRESNSKNTDASLLPTVCWPCFAIHEYELKERTIDKVLRKLRGRFGFKRFLRDGYKTVLEDVNRKYYRPAEIKSFDGIECEWPVFYVFLIIDCLFHGQIEQAKKFDSLLQPLLIDTSDGMLVPKYYYVPKDRIEAERRIPGSQDRLPSPEGYSDGIYLMGQSIYLISRLLMDGLLHIYELDPIRRHLPAIERPTFSTRYSKFQGTAPDLVIQVVLIAESDRLQQLLATYGIQTQTPHQIEPLQIWSPKQLTRAYEKLGVNKKLGFTGRPSRPFGVLSTSKIYRIQGTTVLCYPLLLEISDFYLAQDVSLVIDDCKSDLHFLSKGWKLSGRPTWCMILRENALRGQNFTQFLDLLAQFKQGQVGDIRVRLGRLQSFITSSCIEHLDFLDTLPDPETFEPFKQKTGRSDYKSLTDIPQLLEFQETKTFSEVDLKGTSSYDLVHLYRQTSELFPQVQLLKILHEREGPYYHVDSTMDVNSALERLMHTAGSYKAWHVVRECAALLRKCVDSLAPSITAILVRGKQITVGVFGHEEEVLDKPVSPKEIQELLFAKCLPWDPRQAVLQQELILCIGKLISTSPQLFQGILKIRIGWFVHAMEVEMEYGEPAERVPTLHHLSPSTVKRMLLSILERNITQAELRTSFQKRQLDGALNRVPVDFYDRVWQILERTPGGIKVAGYHLPQQPTLSDMTMYELNFSLLVEQMLSKIVDPSYRQIMVEAFMVVSILLERNPELNFNQPVNMDRIIQDAFDDFRRDRKDLPETESNMQAFFSTPPNVRHGTTSYMAKAVMHQLLDGEFYSEMDYQQCCLS